MTIYFLSGLGVDSRIFRYLAFPPEIKTVFIEWQLPVNNESLQEYARKISSEIDTSQPLMLVGLSFGGILAMEILEFVKPQKTILISSVTQRRELPFYYKLAGLLKLNYLLPTQFINRANFFTYWLFGIKEKRDKLLLNEILADTNTRFARWAIDEILNWQRKTAPADVIRIHGGSDKILPIIKFKPKYLIPDAGHFMVVSHAKEIFQILKAELYTS